MQRTNHPATTKKQEEFSSFSKFSMIIAVALGCAIFYFGYSSFAGTRIGVTLDLLSATGKDSLQEGLVGHWTFDGPDMQWQTTGAEVRDRSGLGNHGAFAGGVEHSAHSGVLGQALHFQNEDYLTMSDPPSGVFDFGVGDFTVSFWAATPPGAAWGERLVSKRGSGVGAGWSVGYTPTDIKYRLDDGTSWKELALGGGSYNFHDGTMRHFVFRFVRNDKVFVNINGVLKESDDISSINLSISNTRAFNINNFASISQQTGSKLIDDVRVYNRALSEDEITRLYQLGEGSKIQTTLATQPTLETGLVGHWTFDGPDMQWQTTGAEVRDRSGLGNHGAILGGLTSRSSVAGVLGQGLGFDGVVNRVRVTSTSSLNFATSTDFTLAAWAKTDEVPETFGSIINKDTVGDPRWMFGMSTQFPPPKQS